MTYQNLHLCLLISLMLLWTKINFPRQVSEHNLHNKFYWNSFKQNSISCGQMDMSKMTGALQLLCKCLETVAIS
jgi:hypothetical protein